MSLSNLGIINPFEWVFISTYVEDGTSEVPISTEIGVPVLGLSSESYNSPSVRKYVHTLVLHLIFFSRMTDCSRQTWGHNFLKNFPLWQNFSRVRQGPEKFQTTELPGTSSRQNHYPPRIGRLIIYVLWSTFITKFYLTKAFNIKHFPQKILELIWWLCWSYLPGQSYCNPLVFIYLKWSFYEDNPMQLLVDQTTR